MSFANIVSSGSDAVIAGSTAAIAGNLPTPNGVVADPGAANNIAEALVLFSEVNLTSPLTIPTLTFFWNKLPAV